MSVLTMNANLRLAIVTAFWLLYVLACAGIIQGIEDSRDMSLRSVFSDDITHFLDEVNSHKFNSSGGEACLTEAELMQFLYRIEIPLKHSFLKGVDNGPEIMEATWFYRHSILYICAVLTTVGYGNIIPMTETGKGFSVFVVLTGVPLTIVYYYVWIERLLTITSVLHHKFYYAVRNRGLSTRHAKAAGMCLVLVTAAVITILLPASFYYACEPEWSYITAIYYCTLTLATAGLGDFVPMKSETCGDYVIVTAIYIVNVVFLTMFMLANLFDIYEIVDNEELKPLTSDQLWQLATDKEGDDIKEEDVKPPTPAVRDFYLTGLGQ